MIDVSLRFDQVEWLLQVIRIARHETEDRELEKYLISLLRDEEE